MSDVEDGLPVIEDPPPGKDERVLDDGDELHARLVEPDQGVAGLDYERDPVAGLTEDDDGLTAEEAAMHITDLP